MNPQIKLADHPVLEPAYKAELVQRLRRELVRGPLDFPSAVKAAEGAYPSDVLAALHQLEATTEIYFSASHLWIHRQRPEVRQAIPQSDTHVNSSPDGLPEPHPVDFDWRFTDNTLTELKARIAAPPSETVAILGAPTLYKHLVDSGVNAWLFDKNPHVIKHLLATGYSSITECDLLEYSAHPANFHFVVADPPWYVEYYQAFLDAAHRLLVPGGKLLLSVLPRLTRPSASADRFKVLEFAGELGFDIIEIAPGFLHYVSPPFEIEALLAEGLTIENWRIGDLFSFLMRSYKEVHSTYDKLPTKDEWHSVQWGNTTIKIKLERVPQTQSFDYQPVSPTGSFKLRSVSRRSPVRSHINLWTSRNVALKVSKPTIVKEALEKIVGGDSASATMAGMAYEYQLSQVEIEKLRQLLELLARDAGLKWSN